MCVCVCVCVCVCETKVWLILILMITKTRFRTNDYILSVIRQDDFQSGNPKTNQVNEKS